MRNAFIILTAATLMASAVIAQEKTESAEYILKALDAYQAPATPETEDLFVAEELAPVDAPVVENVDFDAMLEESRELYVSGEFEAAQKGLEKIVRLDPENIFARMYLRKIRERDRRMAEVRGMKGVDAAWKPGLVNRSYALSADAINSMGLNAAEAATDVSAKFPEVDFPEGSAAIYQPKKGKIFVRNTRENLHVLEEICDSLDISKHATNVDQVEIEAKFVEVSEGTLEELGFQWNFANSVDTGLGGGDVIVNDGLGVFVDGLRGSPDGASPALPFTQPGMLGAGTDSASGDWSVRRLEDTFSTLPASIGVHHSGRDPLDVLISTLDQSAGTDVLSAPRVVTKSGTKAIIRVGQLHHFPKGYEVGASEGNIVHVNYQDFEEKLLGVELEVTPIVDGNQIELDLYPRINELIGWQNHQIAPADSSYTYYQYRVGMQFNHDPVIARLPVFKKREIQTSVTIGDGSTIGMGGLISERIESFEDKVPVLGHIPLLGRLFRNEGERAVKRNLIIFVTARKVAPSGRVVSDRSFE